MRVISGLRLSLLALLALPLAQALLSPPGERVLDAGYHHLGDDPAPEWSEASLAPEGTRYDLDFGSAPNPSEWALAISARSVDNDWWIELNGKRLALLRKTAALESHYYEIPAGSLLPGTNRLSIVPSVASDDITVGALRLIEASVRELLGLVALEIRVRELGTEVPLPARLTLVDAGGALAECYYTEPTETAVRPGVVYCGHGRARVELVPGEYKLYATRGMEWSLAETALNLQAQRPQNVELYLRREVATPGYVAADTHIHTLTFSGHGDASVPERMVTLAGEGVELAIATDHNHNTDYKPYQQAWNLNEHFTAVVGNEVTTEVGHFNAFPLDPAESVPDYQSSDYVTLVQGMRAKGAQVVILNHPRWPDHKSGPFGVAHLDRFTGTRLNDLPCVFDATELCNSTTEEADPLYLFVDWFALLNHGEKVAAVGSSDSHTVAEPVGQGRTYILSQAQSPSTIDVAEACRNLAAGRASIAQGIFVDVLAGEQARMGDLVAPAQGSLPLRVRVAAPTWVRPGRLQIFVNGIERLARDLQLQPGPNDLLHEELLAWPYAHDAWLVCVVTGPGIAGPYWPLLNNYTLAATNPIYIDGNADGQYQSPREIAELRTRGCSQASDYAQALEDVDPGVALQGLDLARLNFARQAQAELQQSASALPRHERIQEWLATLPLPK